MYYKFFNLDISEQISNLIIEKTKEYTNNVTIKTIKDCENYFINHFSIKNSNFHLNDLSREYIDILTQKHKYTIDNIIDEVTNVIIKKRIFPLLYFAFEVPKKLKFSEQSSYRALDLAIREYTQNRFSLDRFSVFCNYFKLQREIRADTYADKRIAAKIIHIFNRAIDMAIGTNNLEHTEEEVRKLFLFEVEIHKSLEKNIMIQKKYLENTYNVIKSFDFNTDDLLKVLIHIEWLIFDKNKFKTLIKKIIQARLVYITTDINHGVVFFHIVNIVHSFLYLSKVIRENDDITEGLQDSINSLTNSNHYFEISNQIKSLSELKQKINKDQILEFSCRLYFETFIHNESIKEYQNLVSLLFDKPMKSKIWTQEGFDFNYLGFFTGIIYNPVDYEKIYQDLMAKYKHLIDSEDVE